MSRSVDERVVEMKFDNQNFEKNVKQSLGTLDKLKGSLDFDKSKKNINELQNSFNNFDVNKLSTDISKIADRFSAFGIMGDQILRRLADGFVDLGMKATNLVKSMTVDQVTRGWDKYVSQTESVQTIMNATGASVEEVEGTLQKLQWFSDETSFSFTDMAAALGQMTSAGGDMGRLVPMLMGIANATAFAGKSGAEFSRAIYNLNQSYSSGYLSLLDWKSVEAAGINSKQLIQTLIDTGVALGTLKEGEVTLNSFRDSLKDKWVTQEVMEQAFGKFAQVTEEAFKLVNSGEFETASDAYEALAGKFDEVYYKAARAGQEAKTFGEVVEATKDAVSSGWMQTFKLIFGNYEEAKVLWTDMANSFWYIFASGAESRNELLEEWHNLEVGGYKDFASAINTFLEAIIEAKEALSDIVYEILPDVDTPNLANAVTAFKNFSQNLKAFFSGETGLDTLTPEVVMKKFGVATKQEALALIESGELLTDTNREREAAVQNGIKFKEAFAGVVSVIDLARKGLITLWNTVKPLFGIVKSAFGFILNIGSSLGLVLRYLNQSTSATKGFQDAVSKFSTKISKKLDKAGKVVHDFFHSFFRWNEETEQLELVGEAVDELKKKISESKIGSNFLNFAGALKGAFDAIWDLVKNIFATASDNAPSILPYISKGLEKIVGWISEAASFVGDIIRDITNWAKNSQFIQKIKDFFASIKPEDIKGALSGIFEFLKKAFEDIKPVIQPVIDLLKEFWDLITAGNFEGFKNLMSGLLSGGGLVAILGLGKSGKGLFESLTGISDSLNDFLGMFGSHKSTAKIIIQIAIALGIMTLALAKLSTLDTEQIVNATVAMGIMMSMLSSFLKVLAKLSGSALFKTSAAGVAKKSLLSQIFGENSPLVQGSTPLQTAAKSLAKIASAMVIFGIAMKIISKIPKDEVMNSIKAIGAFLGIYAAFSAVMARIQERSAKAAAKQKKGMVFGINVALFGAGMLGIATSMVILAGAFALFKKFEWEDLAKGGAVLVGFGLVIAGLAVIGTKFKAGVDAFSWALLKGAAAITLAVPGILALGGVIAILSLISSDKLLAGVVAFGIGIGALALSLKHMDAKGAWALTLAAGGIMVFALALSTLASIKHLGKGLLAALGVVALVAAGCWALNKAHATDVFNGLAKAMSMTAKAALAFAGALLLLKIVGPDSLKTLIDKLGELGPSIKKMFTTVIDAVLGAVLETAPKTILALGQLLWMVLDWLDEQIAPLTQALFRVIGGAIDGLTAELPTLVDKLVNLITVLIQSMANSINDHRNDITQALMDLLTAAVDIVFDFAAELASRIPVVGELLKKAIDGLHEMLTGKEAVIQNPEIRYQNAVGNYKGTGDLTQIKDVIRGMESDDKETRDAAIEAYKDFKQFLSANRDKSVTNYGYDEGGNIIYEETIDYSKGWKLLMDVDNQKIAREAIQKAEEENNAQIEEAADSASETAKEGAEKVNKSAAESFLSSLGFQTDAVNSGTLHTIKALFAGGAEEADVAKLISFDVTEGLKIDPEKIKENGLSSIFALGEGMLAGAGDAVDKAEEATDQVEEALNIPEETVLENGRNIGSNWIKGITAGMKAGIYEVVKASDETAQSIVNRHKAVLQVQSPSKVGREIGMFWDMGLAGGLTQYANEITNASDKVASNIVNAFSDAAKDSSSIISNGFDDSMMPVVDLDNSTAINHLASVMDNQNRRASVIRSGAVAATSGNANYNTKNYGGVNLTIVQRKGEDAKALTQRIMQTIEIETEKKEAALA